MAAGARLSRQQLLLQVTDLPLHLFSFFHLNLAFSSIEEEARPEVIRRCYWPLLRLIRNQRLPVGIEASGYTLGEIERLTPEWIDELKALCADGLIEFIGSGYAQLIGPLVPAAVNRANQRIGLQIYDEILGFRPDIVLVNEQAYSAGLVSIYRDAGYKALIMEWDNPAANHPDWNPQWRYLPQYACGTDGSTLPVIWNKSIPFQKFQRYAHGEMELPEYLAFLHSRMGSDDRTFALYGNDAEIFDFRPGRFKTEAGIGDESEWKRIARLYQTLQADERFKLIHPGQVLDFLDHPEVGQKLTLESAAQPVPVKKQAKYNLTRWAVTGENDLHINSRCWQLYQTLSQQPANDDHWRELCYLWSSDFRTHITSSRLQAYLKRLEGFADTISAGAAPVNVASGNASKKAEFTVQRQGHLLLVDSAFIKAQLNCRRGLAIHSLTFPKVSRLPLCGTLPHGYFDDIGLGADFFSGHLVLELPGQSKVTDLEPVEPEIEQDAGGASVAITGSIQTSMGLITKTLSFGLDDSDEPFVHLAYQISWHQPPMGSLRLGAVTLNPEAFDQQSLCYATHNGGAELEYFALDGTTINHGAPASFLVSASSALGMTEGVVFLGDQHRQLKIDMNKPQCAAIGMMTFRRAVPGYFCRCAFSVLEMDETSARRHNADTGKADLLFNLTITAASLVTCKVDSPR